MTRRAGPGRRRVDVGGLVVQVALSPSGAIFAVTTSGTLIAMDPMGRCAWERRWETSRSQPLTLRVSDEGHPWVGVGGVLGEIDRDGRDLRTLAVARDDRERIGSFLLAPDGFHVLLFRPGTSDDLGPRATKLDPTGTPLWSTTLPVGTIGHRGAVEAGVRTDWEVRTKPAWRPQTWEPICYSGSEPLLRSGDRLLASFYEFPRSGIGCSYGLDAVGGDLLWATDPAPIHTLAIAGPGRFYQGHQGYGAFETRLLGPDGAVLRRWESHGHVVIGEDGRVRCVEMENVLPSRMRFVTLRDDGEVGDGPLLDGYYTTYPSISRGGIVAFWRKGELLLIGDRMAKHVIESDPRAAEEGVMSRMLLSLGGRLVFAVGTEVWIVDAGLGPPAESPWACGGGNARNNPAWP